MENNFYNTIIEYFKLVAFQHKDIEFFDYGESYELNEQWRDYPLLFVETPSTVNYGTVTNSMLELDWATFTINLRLMTLDNEDYDDPVEDEFQETEIRSQERELGRLQSILSQVLKRLVDDCNKYVLKAVINNVGGFNVTRANTDDLLGFRVAITFRFGLFYCEDDGFDTTLELPVDKTKH